jgi:hypothetical protein
MADAPGGIPGKEIGVIYELHGKQVHVRRFVTHAIRYSGNLIVLMTI